MREAKRKLTEYEQKIVDSVPAPEQYPNKMDADAIKTLKSLTEIKQAEVLKILGVTPENPLSISGNSRARLLSTVAEVIFDVDRETKGRNGEISTPTGGQRR